MKIATTTVYSTMPTSRNKSNEINGPQIRNFSKQNGNKFKGRKDSCAHT